MEGQIIPRDLRICSNCRTLKKLGDFYQFGPISKKTGERCYGSLCKPCQTHETVECTRRRNAERKAKKAAAYAAAHTGQQVVLRDAFVGQSMLVVPMPVPQLIADDQIFETAYDSDLALAE
jgi:hypothetical protein